MVFKFDDLIKCGFALQDIKKINSSVASDVNLLTKAISGLTAAQQANIFVSKDYTDQGALKVLIANDIAEADAKAALATARLRNAKKYLNIDYAQQVLISHKVSDAKIKEILASAGVVSADGKEEVSKRKVNVELLKAKLAHEGLTKSQIKAILTELGLGTSTMTLSAYFKGLGASIKLATKSLWTFMTSNPLGWIMLIASAISVIISLITSYVNTQNELV